MSLSSRRDFLSSTAALAAGAACTSLLTRSSLAAAEPPAISFGLVTYMWGADWDLPTLLKNCKKTGVLGVELRTTHAHKVEPDLDDAGREKVRNQFAESGVTFVGIGSDERFDNPDPAKVKAAIEKTKQFIRLSHDIGGSGVKVKPDKFYDNVPHEKTIEQIGKALSELGEYATGFGQQIRLEVHGQCAELPTIKAIMDVAKDENVAVCWNSNPTDLKGDGLEKNFALVRKRFGQTVHVRELDTPDYPFQELMDLLVKTKYEGWMLLEASSKPEDRVAALAAQKKLFDQMLRKAAG
ncbi:MAG: sugar phosphate isomerase/epimerase family protein [Pirellulaceae bacterium]